MTKKEKIEMKILAVIFILFSIEDLRFALFKTKDKINEFGFKPLIKTYFTTKYIRIPICMLMDILLIGFCINYLI
jgi:hypothetical protein